MAKNQSAPITNPVNPSPSVAADGLTQAPPIKTAPTPDNPMPLAAELTPVFPEFLTLPKFEHTDRRTYQSFNMREANYKIDAQGRQVVALTAAVEQLQQAVTQLRN